MDRKNVYLATIDPNAHVLARKYGLGLEISEFCTAYHMDENFGEVGPEVAKKVKCTDRLVLHAPFNELFPCAIDPKARELAKMRYLQAIALAKDYGAKKVVIHGGYNPWIYYPIWYTGKSAIFWREFLKEIPDGMTVCLENVLEEEPDLLLDVIKLVNNPKIRMCLDIGHVNAYSKIGVMEWLETCGPWVSHFHIHNNDGSWDTHSALPEGTIPMVQLLKTAEEICTESTFTLELAEAEGSVRWMVENGLI